jgi:2-iminoacetate synthase
MSIASRTTVGGYAEADAASASQFEVSDDRSAEAFCAALRAKNLEPVFKNWDAAYNNPLTAQELA